MSINAITNNAGVSLRQAHAKSAPCGTSSINGVADADNSASTSTIWLLEFDSSTQLTLNSDTQILAQL
jgi:hypothetical protein